jgi:hypothetical protein
MSRADSDAVAMCMTLTALPITSPGRSGLWLPWASAYLLSSQNWPDEIGPKPGAPDECEHDPKSDPIHRQELRGKCLTEKKVEPSGQERACNHKA